METVLWPASRFRWNIETPDRQRLGVLQRRPVGFRIEDAQRELAGVRDGPYLTLESAMVALQRHTGGPCRIPGSR